MPLTADEKKERKEEIRVYVVNRFKNEKNIDINTSESFRKSNSGNDSEAFAKSIITGLNANYRRRKFWFTLRKEDSIQEIWDTEKLDVEVVNESFAPNARSSGTTGTNFVSANTSQGEMRVDSQTEIQTTSEKPSESFEAFLKDNEIDVFGKWADSTDPSKVTTTLEIAYCHPSQKLVTVKWSSWKAGEPEEVAIGLLDGAADTTPVDKGDDETTIATRVLAKGICVIDIGDFNFYQMVAELRFDDTNENVVNRTFKICHDEGAVAKHCHVLIDFGNGNSARAQILDKDGNQRGGEMSKIDAPTDET